MGGVRVIVTVRSIFRARDLCATLQCSVGMTDCRKNYQELLGAMDDDPMTSRDSKRWSRLLRHPMLGSDEDIQALDWKAAA